MAAAAGDAHPFPIFNARFRFVFPILDADGDLVTAAGSLDSEVSQDQGTFADAANEATEIAAASGMYFLDLIATELDTKCTAVIVKSTGGKTTPVVLYPVRLPVIRTGTAQGGAVGSITLDSGASAEDDFYIGCYVNPTNDTPAGVLGQARRIIDYVGSTKVATVESNFGTAPTSSTTFEVLLTPEAAKVIAWGGNPVADPTVAGVPKVDLVRWLGVAPAALVATFVRSDLRTWIGVAPNGLNTNRVDAFVGAMGADTLTASALATDGINKIRDAILPEQNVALSDIPFLLVAASDHVTPVTGATGLAVTRSIDGAAFAAGTGTIAEVANGIYQYDASMADMNGGKITFRFTASGGTPGAADDRFVTVVTGGGV